MVSNLKNSMAELQSTFERMAVDPNACTFSSSSEMTYLKKRDKSPQIFRSSQIHKAPIKKTRKAHKAPESELEEMAIGHHSQDRGHVIQKEKNNKTGNEELNEEFINLDETKAQGFDQWQKEIGKFKPFVEIDKRNVTIHQGIQHLDKEDSVRREKTHPRTEGPRKPQSSLENLSIEGSHVPLRAIRK